ncbi:MAG: hypothetical protein ACRD0P_25385, partial [Stackebrandtia sp.]
MEQLDDVVDDLVVVPVNVGHLLRHVHPVMLRHLDVATVYLDVCCSNLPALGPVTAEGNSGVWGADGVYLRCVLGCLAVLAAWPVRASMGGAGVARHML